jgi:hypothetical protein
MSPNPRFRVHGKVHRYRRRRGCHDKCIRCGTKRRMTSSGWEWRHPVFQTRSVNNGWTANNPVCAEELK